MATSARENTGPSKRDPGGDPRLRPPICFSPRDAASFLPDLHKKKRKKAPLPRRTAQGDGDAAVFILSHSARIQSRAPFDQKDERCLRRDASKTDGGTAKGENLNHPLRMDPGRRPCNFCVTLHRTKLEKARASKMSIVRIAERNRGKRAHPAAFRRTARSSVRGMVAAARLHPDTWRSRRGRARRMLRFNRPWKTVCTAGHGAERRETPTEAIQGKLLASSTRKGSCAGYAGADWVTKVTQIRTQTRLCSQ